LAEAERNLRLTVLRVTEALEGVDDVASFSSAVHRELGDLGNRGAPPLAHGYPPRAHRVATQAVRLGAVVVVADPHGGRGLSAHQMAVRTEALRDLDAAVRPAYVAAHAAIIPPAYGSCTIPGAGKRIHRVEPANLPAPRMCGTP